MDTEQQVLPKFVNLKTFCKHVGLSHFQFLRIRDRQNIPAVEQGQHKLIEVEVAVKALASEPGIEAILSDRGVALIQGKGLSPAKGQVNGTAQEFMNIKELSKYLGLSRYHTNALIAKYNIPISYQGTSNVVEVCADPGAAKGTGSY